LCSYSSETHFVIRTSVFTFVDIPRRVLIQKTMRSPSIRFDSRFEAEKSTLIVLQMSLAYIFLFSNCCNLVPAIWPGPHRALAQRWPTPGRAPCCPRPSPRSPLCGPRLSSSSPPGQVPLRVLAPVLGPWITIIRDIAQLTWSTTRHNTMTGPAFALSTQGFAPRPVYACACPRWACASRVPHAIACLQLCASRWAGP
jgi:hypothetical protein